jgi:hypothetical protein
MHLSNPLHGAIDGSIFSVCKPDFSYHEQQASSDASERIVSVYPTSRKRELSDSCTSAGEEV